MEFQPPKDLQYLTSNALGLNSNNVSNFPSNGKLPISTQEISRTLMDSTSKVAGNQDARGLNNNLLPTWPIQTSMQATKSSPMDYTSTFLGSQDFPSNACGLNNNLLPDLSLQTSMQATINYTVKSFTNVLNERDSTIRKQKECLEHCIRLMNDKDNTIKQLQQELAVEKNKKRERMFEKRKQKRSKVLSIAQKGCGLSSELSSISRGDCKSYSELSSIHACNISS